MHAHKYDTRYDRINRPTWEKPDNSKDIGRKAIIAQKLANYMKGCAELEKLIDELRARKRLIDSARHFEKRHLDKPDLSDKEKKEIEAHVDELRQEAESKVVSPERRKELKQQIAQWRKKLGPDASSLVSYAHDLSVEEMTTVENMISKLGIILTVGKVIGRGQTGKDMAR